MPQETAAAFSADGWFRTGDLCAIDDAGRVSFHGRLKELIKVGGENVSPLELESFLEQHPEVMVAQTVGMPDKRLGEVVAAFIQRRPGSELSEEELITYCRGRIASFKVPRYVRFVDVWPMSATKIQKHVLRAQLHSELFG
jgi:acyl-CoA synthetase (AMP-forming)/AMP-acid ligase II